MTILNSIDNLINLKVAKLVAIKERNNTVRALRDVVIKKNKEDYREAMRLDRMIQNLTKK